MNNMRLYPEVKKIANKMAQIKRLIELLNENLYFDPEGMDFTTATLVSGLRGKKDGLYDSDNNCIAEYTDDFYVNQSTGYLGDDFSGYVYFKTDVPGQFVRIWFEC